MDDQYVSRIKITTEVYLACLSHTLTTEREEIMGLLFGTVDHVNQEVLVTIYSISLQLRSDKRPDRVEIDPLELLKAPAEAEKLSKTHNIPLKVVGWYHSHPHITCLPSAVDLRTQEAYQSNGTWVGLIFSAFYTDQEQNQMLQMLAFQSIHSEQIAIPIEIIKPNPAVQIDVMKKLVDIGSLMKQEGEGTWRKWSQNEEEGKSLSKVVSDAIYVKNLSKLLEYGSIPLMGLLAQKVDENKERIEKLQQEKQFYLQQNRSGR
eukprot:TRINITY_DN7496_c0_g1_i1.p1 TRINITY_DN7496_c0_g1~~TRINITY_DN7496_c0_g1_i1.p1  ORF type:complete len:262 (-),score=54.03 TRINITY_DN7496_c0_g1_i1:107-892(-)